MGRKVSRVAPAKINLRLKLEGRAADGRHLLSMLNAPITIGDRVQVELRENGAFSVEVSGAPADAAIEDPLQNLATRAAAAFFAHFKLPLGAHIRLDKSVPFGRGFGGGSSDAAAVLRGLSDLLAEPLHALRSGSEKSLLRELLELGAGLGGDVPYFVKGGLCRVAGVGEKVDRFDANFLDGIKFLVVLPEKPIFTKEVYDLLRKQQPVLPAARDLSGEQYGEMLRLSTAGTEYEPVITRTVRASLWRQLLPMVKNDLEPVAAQIYPHIGELLSALRTDSESVPSMTGSGSALFVLPRQFDRYASSDGSATVRSLLSRYPVQVLDAAFETRDPQSELG